MTWRDQVALVTGGARGIGRATARLLAQHGAAVCVNYAAHADAANELVAEITRAGGRALLLISKQADVLEYIAFLANTNMIDKSYLSVAIICEIVLTNQAMKRLRELVPPLAKSPEHQIQDFSRTAACDLSSMIPGILPPQSN
jgi:NAD(P)-dependent dehydrogenase (short-subunit alcohol dehydrogenase family)